MNEEHGPFSVDVAATKENALCKKFFTAEDDGLKKRWKGTVWCNPPFHRHLIGAWVERAFLESQRGAKVVMLLPSRFKDYRWWKTFCVRGEVIFLHDYIRYQKCGEDTTAYIDSVIVIFGPDIIPGSAGQPIIRSVVEQRKLKVA